jgi:thiamine-phosphate pyrophosphorylase
VPWAPPGPLYPIIDTAACEARGEDPLGFAAACLRGGARLLQLRVKGGASGAFLDLADALVTAGRPFGATIVVNDRGDIARMAGADGVHVGQEDLSPDDLRRLVGPLVIGLSTHDERQVDEALASAADYIAVGPIFGTSTKDTGYTARGLELLRYASGRGKPVIAIGGIDLVRAPEAIGAGAAAVAVISDLFAESVEARVRDYLWTLQ